jgi:hypothetical protein
MPNRLAILIVSTVPLFAQDPTPLTADAIMARVAENQQRVLKLRAEYVFEQRVRVETHHFDGKLARKEIADYVTSPTPAGIDNKLQKIEGQYWKKKQKKYLDFNAEPAPDRDTLDGSLIDSFRRELLRDKSKEGIGGDFFPMTAEQQKRYAFKLAGEQEVEGRKTFRVSFRPRDKHDIDWAGEALIDAEEFQVVNVYTKLSRRIPFAVRTFLGTDLPGLGFNVKDQRLEKDVWFPVSFGTEFRLHVLFFVNRDISVSADCSGFKRADVASTIQSAEPKP